MSEVPTSVIINELYQLILASDHFKSLDEPLLMDSLEKEPVNLNERNSKQIYDDELIELLLE